MQLSVSHIGVCVPDLERAQRFYCEGLGFRQAVADQVGKEFSAALEVQGDASLVSQPIERDGFSLELLYCAAPRVELMKLTQQGAAS